MQKPGPKVNLAKTQAEIRLTTGLEDSIQTEVPVKLKGEQTTQQEFPIPKQPPLPVSTQTDFEMEIGLDDGFHADRMLDDSTDTHTGTGTSTGTASQSDTRQKTRSGELSALERHHDPDHTVGCNTCQEDLIDAINDECRINVGDVIASRYEIRTYLGEGGMSAVYAAYDKVIKREVALKILHRDLLVRGKGSLLRFQREAQALGNLDHPNVVKIHHFDADENAQPYIVMDIVRGESLARRLVREGESVRFTDIIDIFVQVCEALEHAHERGVVHRDLKPSNIMVVGNQVKVLDFGIAKLMSEDSDQELQLTRTGEVFGSPLYMSPEQCRGLKLDFRSDIYSIGCVMYEAFTGNPPFTGNSHIDTMLKHVNDLPASVSTSLCDARYIENVDAILLRCMAKNPKERFQSMGEVKRALLQLELENKGPWEKLKQKLELVRLKMGAQGKLTKKMIAAYCAAGLIVTGLGATAIVQSQHTATLTVDTKVATPEHWKTLDEKGQSEFDAGRFAQAEAIFKGELDMANKLKNRQLRFASGNELLDLFNAQLILNPELAKDNNFNEKFGKARNELSQIRKEDAAAAAAVKKDLAAASTMSEAEKVDLCNLALENAMATGCAGDHVNAIALAKDALSVAATTKDKVLIAKAHYILGFTLNDDRQLKEAKAEFEKSLQIREEVLPKDDADIGRSLVCIARCSKGEEALKLLKRAREIFTKAFLPTSHQVGWVDLALATQYYDMNNLRLARQMADSAISKCKGAIETQLTNEEKLRATQTLIRALKTRVMTNRNLLAEDLKRGGKVADKDEREAAIEKDIADGLMFGENLNPKPNVFETDAVISWLLAEKSKRLYRQYETEMSKGVNLPADDSGKPLLLKEAQTGLARAIAINNRIPAGEMELYAPTYYFWMGKISRGLFNLPYAEKNYQLAKTYSDQAFGTNSSESAEIQTELDKIRRDSGKANK